MKFEYRSLSTEDAEAWLALRIEGAKAYPLGFLVTPEEAANISLEQARKIMGFGGSRGVFENQTLIGFCGYRPQTLSRTKHRAELGPFYITTKFHGSGAADALMNGVISEARQAEITQLELFADTENHRAIRFYIRHGFKVVATHPDGVRINGQPRDDHFCIKRL